MPAPLTVILFYPIWDFRFLFSYGLTSGGPVADPDVDFRGDGKNTVRTNETGFIFSNDSTKTFYQLPRTI